MSLGYRFQPIDLALEGHPRAWEAGPEAMGLWLWGMVHAKAHRTGGRLTRAAVLGAWGGKRNAELAKRLVASGLWVTEAVGWSIRNFESKSAGGSSTERVQRFRERSKGVSETEVKRVSSGVTATGLPLPSISTLSVSSSGSQIASPAVAPDWWAGSCDAAEMALGGAVPVDDRPARWAEYSAARDRKGWAVGHKDAVGWLTAVLRSERTRARERPGARGAEITKQPFDPNAPWLKLPEVG